MIEFVNGGDLMFHMQRQRRLPEDHARFYSAEICLALNFLHEKGKFSIVLFCVIIYLRHSVLKQNDNIFLFPCKENLFINLLIFQA